MFFQTGLGISIETTSLSMAYLKASFRTVKLKAQAVHSLPAEKSPEERLGIVKKMIRSFMTGNRIASTDIYLSIPRDLAILRYIELPLAVKENLQGTLGYEMEKYIPFSSDDVYFDGQIISEDKTKGMMTVLLVAAPRDAVAPYFDLCAEIGVGISGMEICATALGSYFFHGGEAVRGRKLAVLYMADGCMEIDLFKDGLLHYSRHAAATGDGKDIVAGAQRELELLEKSLTDEEKLPRILFYGPRETRRLFKYQGKSDRFEIHCPDFSAEQASLYELMPAYGAALKAIQKMPMSINLLPEGLRKKPGRAGYYVMLILSGLLVLSLLSWGGGTIMRKRLDLDRLNTKIKQLSAKVTHVEKIRSRCTAMEEQIAYLNSLDDNHVPALDILRDLSDIIPESAWVNRFSIAGKKVKIEGYADAASELIPLLEESSLFDDVAFVSAITKTKDGKERFRIALKTGHGRP